MKRVRNYLSALLGSFKPLAVAAACALFLFASATPALAIGGFGGASSSPSKGTEQMDSVQKMSEKAVTGPISKDNDGPSVRQKSQEGLNGVQGAANREKMYSPENSQGQTIEENIKGMLEEATP